MSTRAKIVIFVVIILAIIGAYAFVTYVTSPQTVLSFEESFTFGGVVENKEFEVSFLQSKVQVEVTVVSGSSLWGARILNGDNIIWQHAKAQGDQTTYQSGWISLPSGRYYLAFGALGIGSLDANIKVISKGGFW